MGRLCIHRAGAQVAHTHAALVVVLTPCCMRGLAAQHTTTPAPALTARAPQVRRQLPAEAQGEVPLRLMEVYQWKIWQVGGPSACACCVCQERNVQPGRAVVTPAPPPAT